MPPTIITKESLYKRITELERKHYCNKNQFFDTFAEFPTTGNTEVLYTDLSTGNIYIWNGTEYISADTVVAPEQRICLNTATPAFAPLDVNNPTTAEVEAYVLANAVDTNGTQVVYFVDGSCDEPDFIWTVNGVDVTLSYRKAYMIEANNGLRFDNNLIQLGDAFAANGALGQLLGTRFINMNNNRLHFVNNGDDANSVSIFTPGGDVLFGGNTFTNTGRNILAFSKAAGSLTIGRDNVNLGSFSLVTGSNNTQNSGGQSYMGGYSNTYLNGVSKGFIQGEQIIDNGGERNFIFGGVVNIGRYTKQNHVFGNYLTIGDSNNASQGNFNQTLFGRNSIIQYLASDESDDRTGYNFFNIYESTVKGNYSFGSGREIDANERFQFTAGYFLKNKTRLATVFGHSNVEFLTNQNNTNNSQIQSNTTLHFSIGNGEKSVFSSNSFTQTRSGLTQINSNSGDKTQNDVTPIAALEIVSTTKGLLIPRMTSSEITTWQASFNNTTDVTGLSGAGDEKHSRQGEMVYNLVTLQNVQARWNGTVWTFATW